MHPQALVMPHFVTVKPHYTSFHCRSSVSNLITSITSELLFCHHNRTETLH